MVILFLFLFGTISVFADAERLILPLKTFDNYRCIYKSESHMVVHHFKMDKNMGFTCEYSIEVDEQPFKHSFGGNIACQDFIRSLINRGSVCISNKL